MIRCFIPKPIRAGKGQILRDGAHTGSRCRGDDTMKACCLCPGLLLAAFCAPAGPAGAAAPVRIVYAGHTFNTREPVVQFPRGMLVPLRPVAAVLGGRLHWDRAAQTAAVG